MENNLENWSESKLKRRTFFSFAAYLLAAGGGFAGWRWYRSLPETQNGLSKPAREVLQFNEKVNDKFFSEQHLAPTYPKSEAVRRPRVNSDIGMEQKIDINEWRLKVINPATKEPLLITLDDLKTLPKEEIVFDFKCIEGWNEIVNYGGVKFSDFLKKYNLGMNETTKNLYKFAGLETPDGKYYVGIDMKSVLHPQTMLCYEMNGKPLPEDHGAPLRLIIPVKYGIKNLKRVGTLFFADERPRDYWHEDGYDYDAAL